MDFGTPFEVVIYYKVLVVTSIPLESCPSSKLVLGSFALDQCKLMSSPVHQIFANPKFHSKRKIYAMPLGAWYTGYQPEIIILVPLGEGSAFVANLISSSNIAQVSLN